MTSRQYPHPRIRLVAVAEKTTWIVGIVLLLASGIGARATGYDSLRDGWGPLLSVIAYVAVLLIIAGAVLAVVRSRMDYPRR